MAINIYSTDHSYPGHSHNLDYGTVDTNKKKLVTQEQLEEAAVPVATASVAGKVKVGDGLSVTSDGTLSVASSGNKTYKIMEKEITYEEYTLTAFMICDESGNMILTEEWKENYDTAKLVAYDSSGNAYKATIIKTATFDLEDKTGTMGTYICSELFDNLLNSRTTGTLFSRTNNTGPVYQECTTGPTATVHNIGIAFTDDFPSGTSYVVGAVDALSTTDGGKYYAVPDENLVCFDNGFMTLNLPSNSQYGSYNSGDIINEYQGTTYYLNIKLKEFSTGGQIYDTVPLIKTWYHLCPNLMVHIPSTNVGGNSSFITYPEMCVPAAALTYINSGEIRYSNTDYVRDVYLFPAYSYYSSATSASSSVAITTKVLGVASPHTNTWG